MLHRNLLHPLIFFFLATAGTLHQTADAQDTWTNPAGGFFDVGSNWADGTAPNAADSALFNLDNTYTVTWDDFTGDVQNNGLQIAAGDVTFQATEGARRYDLTSQSGSNDVEINRATLNIGGTSSAGMTLNSAGELRLRGGLGGEPTTNAVLNVLARGVVAAESLDANSNSAINVESGGRIEINPENTINSFSSNLNISDVSFFEAGTLITSRLTSGAAVPINVSNFGRLNLDSLLNSGNATVILTGEGTIGNIDRINASGASRGLVMSISVSDGALLSTQTANLGGVLRVSDEGSSFSTNTLRVGTQEVGIFSVNVNATANVGLLEIGTDLGGDGRVSIGSGASLSNSVTLIGGDGGAGELAVSGGGEFSSNVLELYSSGRLRISNSSVTTNNLGMYGGEVIFFSGELNISDAMASTVIDEQFGIAGPLDVDRQLNIAGQVVVAAGKSIAVVGNGLNAGSIVNNGSIVSTDGSFGSVGRHDGYRGDGHLDIRASSTTLLDRGLAELGSLTTLGGVGSAGPTGGNLIAANGFALGSGDVISGFGNVSGRIAASNGSAIYASAGDLTVGDASHVAGFSSHGETYVGDNIMWVLDANQAQLGSYTELGLGSSGGTLNVANGAILDFGDNLVGVGSIENGNTLETAIINNGLMRGNSASDRLIVEGYVKGIGTFDNVQFNGTFAPGLSPTITRGNNFFFGDSSVLEMEIGGLIPGEEHDAIWASGLLSLDGTLEVLLINGFDPSLGDAFDLFNWGTIEGEFDDYILPELATGLRWNTGDLYVTGELRVSAIPEPGTLGIAGLLCCGVLVKRRRRAL